MIYTFILSKRAEKHIESAYDWYELQREGLGDKFIDVIEEAFTSIQSNPLLYGFRKKNVRGCHAKGFPYVVLFYVKRNNIRVVSVFHTSRNKA